MELFMALPVIVTISMPRINGAFMVGSVRLVTAQTGAIKGKKHYWKHTSVDLGYVFTVKVLGLLSDELFSGPFYLRFYKMRKDFVQ
jgi:hypothetical protein